MTKSVLLSAFQCDANGVSESFLAYKWLSGLSKRFDLTLLTGSEIDYSDVISPSKKWSMDNAFFNKVNSAVKLDYFWFNLKSERLVDSGTRYDLVHHVSPVAPRYPVAAAKLAKTFFLGPIAGGLRVPKSFRKHVESKEELFFKLRYLDKLRFKYDRSLKNTYYSADKIFVAGDYVKDFIPSDLSEKCIQFLDVGIDTNNYEFRKRNFTSGVFNLIYVGRIVPYKALDILISSISILPKNIKDDIKLFIVGDLGGTSYEKHCLQLLVKYKLEKNVIFTGFLSKDKVQQYYENAHLFCFPSLAEAGGTVVLEAMAKGLPILCADYGGPSESVSNDSGFKIYPMNPKQYIEEIAYVIENAHSNYRLLEKMGENARNRVVTLFDWTKRIERMSDHYLE